MVLGVEIRAQVNSENVKGLLLVNGGSFFLSSQHLSHM